MIRALARLSGGPNARQLAGANKRQFRLFSVALFRREPVSSPRRQTKKENPTREEWDLPMTRSRMLVVAAVLVCGLLVPAAPAAADSPAQKMIRKVNAYRKHRGVRPLHMSSSLNGSSSKYAHHMMRSGYFAHARRIKASRRFRRLGEILEMHRGYRLNVAGALRAW